MLTLSTRGFVREGFKAIDSIYRHLSNFEKSKVYPGITEYINEKGEGMYHYLTGSASWLLLTVLTQMYGVRGSAGNLSLIQSFFLSNLMKKVKPQYPVCCQ